MNFNFITVLTWILSITISTQANALEEAEVFTAAPDHVYAPQGFDTNDNVELFFEGYFSDACYQVGLTYHEVDEENKVIYVTDTGHHFSDQMCAEVIVPYEKGIQAGLLAKGDYKIMFRHSRGNFIEVGTLPVKPADKAGPDDHLYAPVTSIQFVQATKEEPAYVLLKGKFFNSCMSIDDVQVIQQSDSNVVDILPIAKMIEGNCKTVQEGIVFEQKVSLADLEPGRLLLHVRSLNGKSVNEIIELL